ncbi:MAG: hypothetical protein IK955_02760 [Clostridia bacterium]|nr:hypothetical protein [Clostridia bacterium]
MKKKYTATRIALIFTAVLVVMAIYANIITRIGKLEEKNTSLEIELNNFKITYGTPEDESVICFTNIGAWSGELIEIYNETPSYIAEDENGKYVVIKEGAAFLSFGEDKLKSSQWYSNGNLSGNSDLYKVIDRESLVTDGGKIYKIIEESKVNEIQMIKILETDAGSSMYIPYKYIDINSLILHKAAPDCNYYKAYLKQSK